MPSLADTITKLGVFRAAKTSVPIKGSERLMPLTDFGSNPGALAARHYVPEGLEPGAALVVVLHGCTQNAESYDRGSGWSQIADEQGFALLYPEQVRANNANLCFNWFEPDDVRRGSGEAKSIHQMIEAMIILHELDRTRIFITGLSAGGAMTSAMLAVHPDIFAGGAIIAGLPHGAASNMPEAFAQMGRASASLARVRSASSYKGTWPTVSVWHGDADRVVDASNAAAIVAQWRAVHEVGDTPDRSERGDGFSRHVWTDARGRDVIEHHIVSGMAHGTPLSTRGPEGCGVAGPHMLEAGISSTRVITRFWGLETRPVRPRALAPVTNDDLSATDPAMAFPLPSLGHAGVSPGRVIEDALRAAGLMR